MFFAFYAFTLFTTLEASSCLLVVIPNALVNVTNHKYSGTLPTTPSVAIDLRSRTAKKWPLSHSWRTLSTASELSLA